MPTQPAPIPRKSMRTISSIIPTSRTACGTPTPGPTSSLKAKLPPDLPSKRPAEQVQATWWIASCSAPCAPWTPMATASTTTSTSIRTTTASTTQTNRRWIGTGTACLVSSTRIQMATALTTSTTPTANSPDPRSLTAGQGSTAPTITSKHPTTRTSNPPGISRPWCGRTGRIGRPTAPSRCLISEEAAPTAIVCITKPPATASGRRSAPPSPTRTRRT